jgi:hypothetical protein
VPLQHAMKRSPGVREWGTTHYHTRNWRISKGLSSRQKNKDQNARLNCAIVKIIAPITKEHLGKAYLSVCRKYEKCDYQVTVRWLQHVVSKQKNPSPPRSVHTSYCSAQFDVTSSVIPSEKKINVSYHISFYFG